MVSFTSARSPVLSIHDLTRRSTGVRRHFGVGPFLSIHDLTRRSTLTGSSGLTFRKLSIHDLTRRSTRKEDDYVG